MNTALPTSLSSGIAIGCGQTICRLAIDHHPVHFMRSDWAGISLDEYTQLNPLALCGILAPAPGSLVCAGDSMSFCSNLYTTARGDTCKSITKSIGPIIAMDSDAMCNKIPVGTEVCVAPSANAVSSAPSHDRNEAGLLRNLLPFHMYTEPGSTEVLRLTHKTESLTRRPIA